MTEAHTVSQLLRDAAIRLSPHSDNAASEARSLLGWCLKQNATWLITHETAQPGAAELTRFEDAIRRRCAGEPLAYITGSESFWTLELKVNRDTLIPRPDSEIVVEQALACFTGQGPAQLLDLGTGTGALALSLASEWPSARVIATDIYPPTLAVAAENARLNGIQNVVFLESDWFSALGEQTFDLIVTNPPYIAEGDPHLEDLGLQYEPLRALTSGADGLNDLRQIIEQAPRFLNEGGWLLCEHGYDQASSCQQFFRQSGYLQVRTQTDYAGNDRVTLGQRPHT